MRRQDLERREGSTKSETGRGTIEGEEAARARRREQLASGGAPFRFAKSATRRCGRKSAEGQAHPPFPPPWVA